MKTLNEAVTDRINFYLGKTFNSQYMLAEKSGVPYPTIKSIMQRRTKGITLKTVVMLARGFEVSVSEFLNDEFFHYDELDLE
ncbi:MAG: helix-turn-helix domain-containing protein [Clostridia bacterium]|nr:helix-turn-helix domain-containing protein [Clostridia bacterium]